MPIENDQQKVFNDAIKRVEHSEKELLQIYKSAKKEVDKKIAVFRQKMQKGILTKSQAMKQKQLLVLIKSITEDIKKLKDEQYGIIVRGYADNYTIGYDGFGWSIEKDINTRLLSSYSYTAGYRPVNLAYVKAAYREFVASYALGADIKTRGVQEVLYLQSELRKATAQAIVEGIGPRELAKRLQGIDAVWQKDFNRAIKTARTELLRGFSFGSEEAINVSKDAGIEGVSVWDATLDGKTRKTHRDKDQKQPGKDGLFRFPDGSAAVGPRMPGLSAKESIQCRCMKQFRPFGIKPNARGYRDEKGKWQIGKHRTYKEWASSLEGKRSIEAEQAYQKARAKRLRNARRK